MQSQDHWGYTFAGNIRQIGELIQVYVASVEFKSWQCFKVTPDQDKHIVFNMFTRFKNILQISNRGPLTSLEKGIY